jgi:hypothetical protein
MSSRRGIPSLSSVCVDDYGERKINRSSPKEKEDSIEVYIYIYTSMSMPGMFEIKQTVEIQ